MRLPRHRRCHGGARDMEEAAEAGGGGARCRYNPLPSPFPRHHHGRTAGYNGSGSGSVENLTESGVIDGDSKPLHFASPFVIITSLAELYA